MTDSARYRDDGPADAGREDARRRGAEEQSAIAEQNGTAEPAEPYEDDPTGEWLPSTDFPAVPSRDTGPGGTRDVDPPPNTDAAS